MEVSGSITLIHKTEVEKYSGSLEELAIDIGNLRYDALEQFFMYLHEKISSDAFKDNARGREQLANLLWGISDALLDVESDARRAWEICKEYV